MQTLFEDVESLLNEGMSTRNANSTLFRMRFAAAFLVLPCAISLNILMYVNVAGKSHLQFAEKLIALMNDNGHKVVQNFDFIIV